MKDYQQENQDILDEWQNLSNKKRMLHLSKTD